MELSPFPYQGPLAPHEVRGRDALLEDLTARATRLTVTALLGPRRFGKTSVLKRLAHDLTEVSTVWLDLYGATAMLDLTSRFDRALATTAGPFESQVRHVAASVRVNLGMVQAEFSRPTRERPDPATRMAQLLQVFVTTAASAPALLVIDEFSSIANVRGAAELIRTEFQHHYRDFGLILSGSEPSTMRELFTDQAQPFYGQADLVSIGPLSLTDATSIVSDGFETTDRLPGNVPSLIADLTGGHPQRTMQVADAVWELTPTGGDADDVWGPALTGVRNRVDTSMRMLLDQLAVGEQRVLRVVANGGSPHGSAGDRVGLTKGAATHALAQLAAKGHLHTDHRLVDPLLADWLRHRLPLP